MRGGGPVRIGKVLRDILESAGMSRRLDEHRAAEVWPRVAGQEIASMCAVVRVERGTMVVAVPSPAWATELYLMKPALLDKLEKELRSRAIRDIRFVAR